jgi:hypothetical protein
MAASTPLPNPRDGTPSGVRVGAIQGWSPASVSPWPGHEYTTRQFSGIHTIRFDKSWIGPGAFLNSCYSLPLQERVSLISPLNLVGSGAPGNDAKVDETIAGL